MQITMASHSFSCNCSLHVCTLQHMQAVQRLGMYRYLLSLTIGNWVGSQVQTGCEASRPAFNSNRQTG